MLVLFSLIIHTECFGGLHGPVSRLENTQFYLVCKPVQTYLLILYFVVVLAKETQ